MGLNQIQIYQARIDASRLELGLTRDKYTKAELRKRLRSRLRQAGWKPQGYYGITTPLGQLIDEFSEKSTGADVSINKYFQKLPQSGFTPGGRRATDKPLRYERDKLLPSEHDIGALGEAVAGYYLEAFEKLQFEVRPFGVDPDFVFLDGRSVVLCQIKASLGAWPKGIITAAMGLLDVMAKTKFIRKGSYIGYIILVKIEQTGFELRRLRIEEK